MLRLLSAAASLALASSALAQATTTTPGPSTQPQATSPSQPQQYVPPTQSQPTAPPQGQTAPAQGQAPQSPQAQPPQYPQAQPVPSSPGPGSQQVVVNPPAQQAAPPPAPPAPSANVNPPATGTPANQSGGPVVVERETGRPALETVAIDAAYGAVAGALVGVGIALIDGNNFGRDLTIGAGAGILVGAVVGGFQAYSSSNRPSYAMDGLGSPERDRPHSSGRSTVSFSVSGRF